MLLLLPTVSQVTLRRHVPAAGRMGAAADACLNTSLVITGLPWHRKEDMSKQPCTLQRNPRGSGRYRSGTASALTNSQPHVKWNDMSLAAAVRTDAASDTSFHSTCGGLFVICPGSAAAVPRHLIVHATGHLRTHATTHNPQHKHMHAYLYAGWPPLDEVCCLALAYACEGLVHLAGVHLALYDVEDADVPAGRRVLLTGMRRHLTTRQAGVGGAGVCVCVGGGCTEWLARD